jgi:PIN domain nuclease of toxin-antitoxin system
MLLLDSHCAYWLLVGSSRMGSDARRRIDEATAVHVSAVTVWEMSIKSLTGKIDLPDRFVEALTAQGLTHLPITSEQAEGVRTLPDALRRHDPFDRLLVAQARALGLTLLTADRVLLGLDLPFVVDATR